MTKNSISFAYHSDSICGFISCHLHSRSTGLLVNWLCKIDLLIDMPSGSIILRSRVNSRTFSLAEAKIFNKYYNHMIVPKKFLILRELNLLQPNSISLKLSNRGFILGMPDIIRPIRRISTNPSNTKYYLSISWKRLKIQLFDGLIITGLILTGDDCS